MAKNLQAIGQTILKGLPVVATRDAGAEGAIGGDAFH